MLCLNYFEQVIQSALVERLVSVKKAIVGKRLTYMCIAGAPAQCCCTYASSTMICAVKKKYRSTAHVTECFNLVSIGVFLWLDAFGNLTLYFFSERYESRSFYDLQESFFFFFQWNFLRLHHTCNRRWSRFRKKTDMDLTPHKEQRNDGKTQACTISWRILLRATHVFYVRRMLVISGSQK